MNRMFHRTLAAMLAVGSAAPATATTITGAHDGLKFVATKLVVGAGSTATVPNGGDPRYFANAARYNGTVALVMETATGTSVCSGSLMADRQSILTAGHCVGNGAGTANPLRTTAYFYNGTDPDYVLTGAQSTAITVSDYFVNADYTGATIDENDIAVLRLSQAAPLFATAYDLYTGDASGKEFNVTGVGSQSTGGGSPDSDLGVGRRRQGNNVFDFALGDAGIGGLLDGDLGQPGVKIANILLADFDSGLEANDASCIVTLAVGVQSTRYCNLGLGRSEASVSNLGDSGGASFIDGKVAAVTSFGLSFGSQYGDIDDDRNATFGEFGGYVSTAYHANWINSVLAVPEPGTWSLMLTGFAMTGLVLRRRRRVARVTFART